MFFLLEENVEFIFIKARGYCKLMFDSKYLRLLVELELSCREAYLRPSQTYMIEHIKIKKALSPLYHKNIFDRK